MVQVVLLTLPILHSSQRVPCTYQWVRLAASEAMPLAKECLNPCTGTVPVAGAQGLVSLVSESQRATHSNLLSEVRMF